jgi:hypothetical protein
MLKTMKRRHVLLAVAGVLVAIGLAAALGGVIVYQTMSHGAANSANVGRFQLSLGQYAAWHVEFIAYPTDLANCTPGEIGVLTMDVLCSMSPPNYYSAWIIMKQQTGNSVSARVQTLFVLPLGFGRSGSGHQPSASPNANSTIPPPTTAPTATP